MSELNKYKNSLLTRTMPDGTQDTSPVDQNEIRKLEGMSQDYSWNTSSGLSFDIGRRLFSVLNGDRQTLIRALKEADENGELSR